MKNGLKINSDLLNEIRLNVYGVNINIDIENIDIVPNELTHYHLLYNNLIGDNILAYYFLPTSKILTDVEYETKFKDLHQENKDRILSPYGFKINGAFHKRLDLLHSLSHIYYTDEKPYINGSNKINSLIDLLPYFDEYSQGFKKGYGEFEIININPYLPMFPDKNDFFIKVHEFLTKDSFGDSWLTSKTMSFEMTNNPKGGDIIGAFQDGLLQGYFYRAWTIVLSNSRLLDPLFAKTNLNVIVKSSNYKAPKLTAKHYALYYVFKTYASGDSIPTSDGGFAKTELEKIGVKLIGGNGNGFYKAVLNILDYDLNSGKELKAISNNWKEIVLFISNNDKIIIEYINRKGL